MKRLVSIIFSFIFFFGLSTAQFRVISNGNVQIGNWESSQGTGTSLGGGLNLGTVYSPDTLSTLAILGKSNARSGGYISFGGRQQVSVGEDTYSSFFPNARMILQGADGVTFKCGTSTLFDYRKTTQSLSTTPAFTFSAPVSAPQYLTSSDYRLKKNIESLQDCGNYLTGLTPVKYQLRQEGLDPEEAGKKSTSTDREKPIHFGFIAQEVRDIFPELVFEDDEGLLSIDYIGFIPLLVDAIKGLKTRIAIQDDIIAELTGVKKDLSTRKADADETFQSLGLAKLSQNRPNPFSDSTIIDCFIPENTKRAILCIYDLNGHQQKQFTVSERGETSVSFSRDSLSPGIYLYTLLVDGREVETRRMILME